jgi:hypothetical protein
LLVFWVKYFCFYDTLKPPEIQRPQTQNPKNRRLGDFYPGPYEALSPAVILGSAYEKEVLSYIKEE